MLCIVYCEGERTLVQAMAELVVGGDEVEGSLRVGVVGCDGVDEGAEGLFDAVELRLEDIVHFVGWECGRVQSVCT